MSFNIYLAMYCVVALAVVGGGSYKLNQMTYSTSAFLYLVGSLGLFVLYGIRWFGAKGSIFSDSEISWPSNINTCPDFLTYYERTKADGTKLRTCIDRIGVSRNGALQVFPANGNAPSGEGYYFSLETTAGDQEGKRKELCQRCITMGLTWEGVSNGEGCVTPVIVAEPEPKKKK
jgi:hypothetical protein